MVAMIGGWRARSVMKRWRRRRRGGRTTAAVATTVVLEHRLDVHRVAAHDLVHFGALRFARLIVCVEVDERDAVILVLISLFN